MRRQEDALWVVCQDVAETKRQVVPGRPGPSRGATTRRLPAESRCWAGPDGGFWQPRSARVAPTHGSRKPGRVQREEHGVGGGAGRGRRRGDGETWQTRKDPSGAPRNFWQLEADWAASYGTGTASGTASAASPAAAAASAAASAAAAASVSAAAPAPASVPASVCASAPASVPSVRLRLPALDPAYEFFVTRRREREIYFV